MARWNLLGGWSCGGSILPEEVSLLRSPWWVCVRANTYLDNTHLVEYWHQHWCDVRLIRGVMIREGSGKPILITGSHNSGSTWLASMLALTEETLVAHEPFNIEPWAY